MFISIVSTYLNFTLAQSMPSFYFFVLAAKNSYIAKCAELERKKTNLVTLFRNYKTYSEQTSNIYASMEEIAKRNHFDLKGKYENPSIHSNYWSTIFFLSEVIEIKPLPAVISLLTENQPVDNQSRKRSLPEVASSMPAEAEKDQKTIKGDIFIQ